VVRARVEAAPHSGFQLVLADAGRTVVLRNTGAGLAVIEWPQPVLVLTNEHAPGELTPRGLAAALVPTVDVARRLDLLAALLRDRGAPGHHAICKRGEGYGTVSSSLLAVPAGALLDLLDRVRLWSRAGGLRAAWQSHADDALAGVWSSATAGRGPVAVRDLDFLRWRIDASPLLDARYLVVRDRGGMPAAWFACEAREHSLHVVDFWSSQGAAGPMPAQLAALLRAARAGGHASVSVELSTAAATTAWQGAGFAAREARPVFGRACEARADAFPAHAWLTTADEDE